MAIDLQELWQLGYSIAELWGASRPVTRGTSSVASDHLILWGILSIVEYQVNRGAGHAYLRERLAKQDWIAIGYAKPRRANSRLVRVPPMEGPEFGKMESAIGNVSEQYVHIRVLNAELMRDTK